MPKLLSCLFHIDTGCIETTIYSRAEMDWLIYNDPLSCAQLALDGALGDYQKWVSGKHSVDLANIN